MPSSSRKANSCSAASRHGRHRAGEISERLRFCASAASSGRWPVKRFSLLQSRRGFGHIGAAAAPCRASGCSSGVEHNLAKVGVEGSNPFARSIENQVLSHSFRVTLGSISVPGQALGQHMVADFGVVSRKGDTNHPLDAEGKTVAGRLRPRAASSGSGGGGCIPQPGKILKIYVAAKNCGFLCPARKFRF